MTAYDIYIATNNEEATAHGAEFTYDGMNPADALARFIADADAMGAARGMHDGITEFTAMDDDLVASVYPLDDGAFELHIYAGETDTAITIPPTEYVSLTDAAEMLGVSRQRVHVMLQNGQLNGRLIGNAWIIARASVASRI